MTSLIGTHQVKSFSSPVNTAAAVDANLVRGNDNVLRKAYVAHDADATIHVQSSTLAARPAAGIVGRKWMTVDGTSVRMWYDTGATWIESGNVIGPASSTDNAVARFDSTTGRLLQDSVVLIGDTGAVTGVTALTVGGTLTHTGLTANLTQSATTADVFVGAGTGSGATTLTIKGAAGTNRSIALATAGAWRWAFVAGTTAESGANAGSNFALAAYNDAGAFIDSPMSITRAAGGAIQTSRPVDINVSTGLRVLGTKVVGAQGATIADPTGGVTIDTEARTAINALIDRLQAHGLIA